MEKRKRLINLINDETTVTSQLTMLILRSAEYIIDVQRYLWPLPRPTGQKWPVLLTAAPPH